MYQAKAVTAYVYAILAQRGAIISGAFQADDGAMTYHGNLYVGGIKIHIFDDCVDLYMAFPEHVMQGAEGRQLSSLIELPSCGDKEIDEALRQLPIASITSSRDDKEEELVRFAFAHPQKTYTVDMMRGELLYARRPQ